MSITAPRPTIDLNPHKLEFGSVFAPLWLSRVYDNGAWQDAQIENLDDIRLHPAAIVLHYGQSIFEGLKAYKWDNGSINLFRPIENARRFNRSAERMAMPVLDEAEFVEGIRSLVDKQRSWIPAPPGSLYIRPNMIGTEPCIGVRPADQFLYFVIVAPSGAYFPQTAGQNGVGMVKVFVTSAVGRAAHGGTGNVKATANYAVTLKIIDEGKAKGCSQVLFLDATGNRNIEELGGMNIFFVSGRTLITPALTDTILPGITRDSIIKIAPALGYDVEERKVNMDALCEQIKSGEVTEAFACGTAAVIAGIKNLLLDTGEDIAVGDGAPGPVMSAFYERLTGIQYGKLPDPFGWIVKV
jgi:branched-chain amino acid aminotransferase